MKLVINNKEISLINCTSFYQRLKGFMFTKQAKHALMFQRCNSIHTFFMKMNIDVLMCDKNDNILFIYNNLKPNKIIFPKKNVYKVIEIPTGIFNINSNTKIKIKID